MKNFGHSRMSEKGGSSAVSTGGRFELKKFSEKLLLLFVGPGELELDDLADTFLDSSDRTNLSAI